MVGKEWFLLQGIYCIKNIINGKVYIGSSSNIPLRWKGHLEQLQYNVHENYKLQKDFKKYKINNFTFSILELVKNKKELLAREQEWIDSIDIDENYNILSYSSYEYIDRIKDNYSILDFKLSDEVATTLRNNLIIHNNRKMISYDKLSKKWFLNAKEKDYNQLKNHIINYLRNYLGVGNKEIYWTTYIEQQKKLSGKGYTKGFVSLTSIPLKKRNALVYVADNYANGFIKHKITINDDDYALKVLLKWIINVADIDKPINIYIPSKRMYRLLKAWIEEGNS